jgi:hypothetical protein
MSIDCYISLGSLETSTVRLDQLDAPSIVLRVNICVTAQRHNPKPAPPRSKSLLVHAERGRLPEEVTVSEFNVRTVHY